MRNTNEIFVDPSFKLMEWLTNEKTAYVTIPKLALENYEGKIGKSEKGFEIELANIFQDVYEPFDMTVKIGEHEYFLENFTMHARNAEIKKSDSSKEMIGSVIVQGNINELSLKPSGPVRLEYQRFIIQLKKSERILYYLETNGFKDEGVEHFYGNVPVSVGRFDLNLYDVGNEKNRYLVIDAKEPMAYDEFGDVCHSIMIAYGLLCGTFHQDEAFYLSSDDPTFNKINSIQYLGLRESLGSVYNPIYTNPYGYTDDDTIANEVKEDMKPLSQQLFSKLCSLTYSDKKYASLIILILEANTASLILKPAGYSVALEQLTNMIAEEHNGLKPINDKKLATDFKQDLLKILDAYGDRITANGGNDALTILRKNLENVNKPTNREKLTKPFELYGIPLSEFDIQAIANRNSFLHGKELENLKGEGKASDLHLFHTSLRLNVLLNKLIFKHLGYEGRIINQVKYHEDQLEVEIAEDLFFKV